MTNANLEPAFPYEKDIYAFVGRVTLQLVAHNVDAITTTTFLREIVEAGHEKISLEQAKNIAKNYIDLAAISPC